MSPNPPNAAILANLTQAAQNVSALLAQITAQPKPTYSIDGQNVSWAEYYSTLVEKQEKLNQLIQVAGGVFEFQTQMIPGGTNAPGVWPM